VIIIVVIQGLILNDISASKPQIKSKLTIPDLSNSIVKFTINEGNITTSESNQDRVHLYIKLIEKCNIKGQYEFIIDVSDNIQYYNYDVLAFAKKIDQDNVRLIPSFEFYYHDDDKFGIKHIDYKHKINKAFWRGGPTGSIHNENIQEFNDNNWFLYPRSQLLLNCDDIHTCDVGLHKTFDSTTNSLKKYVKNKITMDEHENFKILINVDGNTCALRFKELLSFNSVVLKQDSPFIEYYYNFLNPFTDYIPINYDSFNVKERINWVLANPEFSKAIAEQGTKTIKQILTMENVCDYFENVIKIYTNDLKFV